MPWPRLATAIIVAGFVALPTLGHADTVSPSDKEEIKSTFAAFIEAVKAQRGYEAGAYVAENVLSLTQWTRDIALHASWDELQKLQGAGFALVMRATFDDWEFEGTARDVFGRWLEKGLVLEPAFGSYFEAGDVVVSTNGLAMIVGMSGVTLPTEVYFTKEGADWRINSDGLRALFLIDLYIDRWLKTSDHKDLELLGRHKISSAKKLKSISMVIGPVAQGAYEPSFDEWAAAVFEAFGNRPIEPRDKQPRQPKPVN